MLTIALFTTKSYARVSCVSCLDLDLLLDFTFINGLSVCFVSPSIIDFEFDKIVSNSSRNLYV